jgi:mono/diheme cytochrome c family protein
MIRRVLLSAGLLALLGTAAIRAEMTWSRGSSEWSRGSSEWSRGSSDPRPEDRGLRFLQEGTVKAGIYAKDQAERGKATYDKICAACHGFKPSEKSKDNPDLGGEAFLSKWDSKPVHELATVIYTTMPNDGSAVIDEAQTADVVAYILQQNNFPAGAQPFKWDATARKILIVK